MTDFQTDFFPCISLSLLPFNFKNPHDPNNRMIKERKALPCYQLLCEFREFGDSCSTVTPLGNERCRACGNSACSQQYLLRVLLLGRHNTPANKRSSWQCMIALRWLQHTSPRQPTPIPAETKPQHAQKRSCESNRWRH